MGDLTDLARFSVDDAIKRFGDYGRTSATDNRLLPKADNWYAIVLFEEWVHIGEVVDKIVSDELRDSIILNGPFGAPFKDAEEWKSEFARFKDKTSEVLVKARKDLFGELSLEDAFVYWEEFKTFAIRANAAQDFLAENGAVIQPIIEAAKEAPERIGAATSEIAELLAKLAAETAEGLLKGIFKGLGVFGVVLVVVVGGGFGYYLYQKKGS